jgi:hypothetical protein
VFLSIQELEKFKSTIIKPMPFDQYFILLASNPTNKNKENFWVKRLLIKKCNIFDKSIINDYIKEITLIKIENKKK